MSIDLGNLLQSQLGNVLGNFLTKQGESAENGAVAANLVLPSVVGGLLKNLNSRPENARNLFDLINGQAGQSLSGAVAQASEGTNWQSLISLGKTLLPNLFGGNAADVADEIANQSGISKAASGSLLALALPLVLSVLRGENLNMGQLLRVLGGQQEWLGGALNTGLLSALGIGSVSGLSSNVAALAANLGGTASAAAAAGSAAVAGAAAKKSGLGKWLALGLAALLALFAFKSCSGDKAAAPQQPAAASAPAEASAVDTPAAASEVQASNEPVPEPSAAAESSQAVADAADMARVVYENGVATFYFATAKADVAADADVVAAEVVQAGKDGKKLVVSGFADSTGNAAANEELSKNRAMAVKAFLEAQGVNADNIELRKPENTTGAVGNDVEGRRVEVRVE
ncbi:DUF937 domain-containing protein [Neisseria leonii]|uniref:DUF937 domain-containing protein n=1 Tax=Neisseria leonii TaxID=2995413 RepID=A0A9X4E1F4_9NEIS|nr:DUF937 domain-containing protein [Neisseria sp. 51.81]MDD9327772.1 DUF937 domain-containing protein [Neisseria sp. 51.81]